MKTRKKAKEQAVVGNVGPLDDLDGQLMVMAAYRYCLGRQSYITRACIDWLRKWWPKFEKNTQCVMVRDIVLALQDSAAGSTYDAQQWKTFAEWAFNALDKEDKMRCEEQVMWYRQLPWPLATTSKG